MHYQRLRNSKTLVESDRRKPRKFGAQGVNRCHNSGCSKTVYAKKLCISHYSMFRWVRPANTEGQKCLIPDCRLIHAAKGYCKFHYDAIKLSSESYNYQAKSRR